MTVTNSTDNQEQIDSLTRELELIRERYQKLLDAHRQLQTQNSILEERILLNAEEFLNEKSQLEQQLIDAKIQIINYKNTVDQLEIEKQRYKDDCNLAVRLLHQHPQEFISLTSKEIQDYQKNKNESTTITSQHAPSSHSLLIPTFPPTFVTTLPTFNTTNSSSSLSTSENQSRKTSAIDNARLVETLFKSETIHRSPSTYFTCSKCHQITKLCDVGIQISADDINVLTQNDTISHSSSDNESNSDTGWLPNESHCVVVKRYSIENIRKAHQDIRLPFNTIPQMHHV